MAMQTHQYEFVGQRPTVHNYAVVNITDHASAQLGDANNYVTVHKTSVHINGVISLAWDLYKRCKTSPETYCNISQELNSLHATLMECEETFPSSSLTGSRSSRLTSILSGCTQLLEELDALVKKYEGLGLQSKRTWDRMKWHSNDITELRVRLISNMTILTAFLSTSLAHVAQKLEELLLEFQRGNLDGSVVSTLTIDSLNEGERAQWRTIRKQFEEHGITLDMFLANREFIIEWFANASASEKFQEQAPNDAVDSDMCPSEPTTPIAGAGTGPGCMQLEENPTISMPATSQFTILPNLEFPKRISSSKSHVSRLSLNYCAPLERHTGPVKAVSFSPDDSQLASASYDRTARLWNAKTGHSSKMRGKDDPRISGDSLGNRGLENFDGIPSTAVYPKRAQVEVEDFYEEASPGESENWNFPSVKSLPTDYEYLEKRLARSQAPFKPDIDFQDSNAVKDRESESKSKAETTPWEVRDQSEELSNPEITRLKKRKHIIKELVDIEFVYHRDMLILRDIYMGTAAWALTEDDIRIVFGNVKQVQLFVRDFLTALRQSLGLDRKKEKKESVGGLINANSSSSTGVSHKVDNEASEIQKDRETRLGEAFEGSLKDMEMIYTKYIRNRYAANQRLEALQRSLAVQVWLEECRDSSSDLTHTSNLDALLIKPVQRITHYPLLLKRLIDATTADHPDLPTLRRVLISMRDVNIRINDIKKRAELLNQALVYERGQSDVGTSLLKVFGRSAEKLHQHIGNTDLYEDPEHDKLRIAYENNFVQLMLVANDCQGYEKGMIQWVDKMVQVAGAVEGWVDIGHSHHQQKESKLRHLAMIIHDVQNIALPDHLECLQRKVIKPMVTAVDMLTKFKDDPKGLLHKRDKRLVDYVQMKNKKDKDKKWDKKIAERMDQWEALNTETKERLRELLRATAHLVQTCQGHLVQLQMAWMAMIQQRFASVMGINVNQLSPEDIERDWWLDFDSQEASALMLGICNGTLVPQATNMTGLCSRLSVDNYFSSYGSIV